MNIPGKVDPLPNNIPNQDILKFIINPISPKELEKINCQTGTQQLNRYNKDTETERQNSITKSPRLWHCCHECGIAFRREDNLREHSEVTKCGKEDLPRIRSKQTSCDILHCCQKCGIAFRKKFNLERHSETCDNGVGRDLKKTHSSRYECDYCGKTFTRKDNLVNHLKVTKCGKGNPPGNRSKQTLCEKCGKLFAREQTMRIHEMMVHNNNKE